VQCVAFSPDGKLLVSGDGGSVDGRTYYGDLSLWDAQTGALRRKLRLNNIKSAGGRVYSVSFSSEGKTLAFAVGETTVRLWDVEHWQLQRTIKSPLGNSLTAVAFSPDGKWLATGGKYTALWLWNVRRGQAARPPLQVVRHNHALSIQFSPDAKTVAAAVTEPSHSPGKGTGRYGAQLWSLVNGKVVQSWMNFPGGVNAVAFSPDGRLLATASDGGARAGEVRVWEVETGRLKQTHRAESRELAVAFSPRGDVLASGGNDQLIKLWSLLQERQVGR
jgi:WD40 repeat protein